MHFCEYGNFMWPWLIGSDRHFISHADKYTLQKENDVGSILQKLLKFDSLDCLKCAVLMQWHLYVYFLLTILCAWYLNFYIACQ